MGQVVGESSAKIEVPATTPITLQDLMATIFHMYGMEPRLQFVNNQGRPVFLIENRTPISELIQLAIVMIYTEFANSNQWLVFLHRT
jgi:hypothetical protein